MEETKDIQETSNQIRIESMTSSLSANQTNKHKTQDFGSPVNSATVDDTRKKMKTNMLDIFDIPLYVYSNKIKRCLNFYGKAEIIKTQNIEKFRAIFIKIKTNNPARLLVLQKAWSIHFEEEKLLRITSAKEITLLQQLKAFKVKRVFIPNNSNSNQCKIAIVFFDLLQDLQDATRSKIYYYNTKLLWKENKLVKEAKIRTPEIAVSTSYLQLGEMGKKEIKPK
ncbi:25222_t:CDS:2 [Gigaspora margarita]|uniref:25222_t:CDS:1 n=1 Tax=Gigaspora margarita TaxID=4874 RepID=A0ABN7VAM0_GIGMA|nr:25222_t:CDS:2 [Gigaspora margarita]